MAHQLDALDLNLMRFIKSRGGKPQHQAGRNAAWHFSTERQPRRNEA